MLPALLLFVLWLALYGRLGTYAGLATVAAPASTASATSGPTEAQLRAQGNAQLGSSIIGDTLTKWSNALFGTP